MICLVACLLVSRCLSLVTCYSSAEISSIREIETLWQNASPDSQSLILAMIKAALDHLGQRGN